MVTFRKPQKTDGAAIKPVSASEKHHISPRNAAFRTSKQPVSDHNKARFANRSGLYFYPVYLKRCIPTVYANPPKLAYLRPESLSDENIAIFSSYAGYLFISPSHILYIYTHPAPCFHTRATAHRHGLHIRTASRNPLPCTYVVSRCRPLRPCALTHAPPLFKNKQQLKNKINTADSTKFIIFARS